jgi:hypothetical protein
MLDIPMVSFQGLQMGVLSNQPSDVEMLSRAGPPVTYISPDGRRMVVTKFYVTTYVTPTKTQVAVKADFSYAIARQPDGQPDWIAAQTAELPVGITRSATTNQTRLIEGDFSPKISPLAQVTPWLLYRTWPLALPMVVALALMLRQRMTAEKVLSKNAKIWLIFNAVEADAAASGGYTNEHYRRILAALRDHLDVLGLDTTQTLVELKGRPELNAEAVDFVINREVLFFDPGSAISEEEHQKFMYSLKVLVPMPRQ